VRRVFPLFVIVSAFTVALHAAAILQLRVVEGEGEVSAVGSRATRGITVLVTDETGRPVENAAVSFTLPSEGPGGSFSDGLKTNVVTTKADGRASVWGMQWNRSVGAFEIRITASKDHARAGIVSAQYLSDKIAAHSGGSGVFTRSHRSYKVLLIGVAVGAAVAGASAFAIGHSSQAAVSATPPPVIGAPGITIGHP
jgi:hypothetical protein